MASNPEKEHQSKRFCSHCDRWLSKASFYEHKAMFFDSETQAWAKESEVSVTQYW